VPRPAGCSGSAPCTSARGQFGSGQSVQRADQEGNGEGHDREERHRHKKAHVLVENQGQRHADRLRAREMHVSRCAPPVAQAARWDHGDAAGPQRSHAPRSARTTDLFDLQVHRIDDIADHAARLAGVRASTAQQPRFESAVERGGGGGGWGPGPGWEEEAGRTLV